jgi:hypothetical protein
LELNMAIPRKKQQSASDVLRQEMQQPLVIPPRETAPTTEPASPEPTPTPTPTTDMTQANDDAAQKAAQAAKEQQEQLTTLMKELKDAKEMIVKLAAQGQAPAKGKSSSALAKAPAAGTGLTARPTQSREETARRRANTDIGWLD